MSTRAFLIELRRRGVLKAALAYAAISWVALQFLSLLFDNFDAPGWVIKVITTLVILGFPVACLMAWGFDITPEGVRPVTPMAQSPRVSPAIADTTTTVPGETTAPPSIAVLPFVDMSAEHDQQYLGDGIAEELLNALAAIEGLNVAARTSSFSFHGKSATMEEIGKVLHVRHVLEGSVRRSGSKLRVTAQLIDVESGFHRYSQAYDREVQDIFAIQNEIAIEIVQALLPRLGLEKDAKLVSHGTSNLEAYNLRLRGHRWLYNPDPATAGEAIAQLRQSVEVDPRYADAWADLAYVYGYLSTWTGEPVPLLLEFVRAATVALVHDPENALGLIGFTYTSMMIDRDPAAAAAWYERSRANGADPSIWAFHKAYVFDGPLGHYDDAIAQLTAAEARDPLAPNVKHALVELRLHSGRIAEAVATAEAIERLPSVGPEIAAICGLAHLAAGDLPRAKGLLETAQANAGRDFMGLLPLSLAVNAATGNSDDTRRLLTRLLEHHAEGKASSAYMIGEVYKSLGDYDKAFEWWTRSVERYETWSLTVLPLRNRNHPVIGTDPRFHSLLRRMRLEPDGGSATSCAAQQ